MDVEKNTESQPITKLEEFESVELQMGDSRILEVPNGGGIEMFLGSCVGVVGFSRKQKLIFGEHFTLRDGIDKDIKKYVENLKNSGIQISDIAVAGGSLSSEEKEKDLKQLSQAVKSIIESGIKNYLDLEILKPPHDKKGVTLKVRYENNKFEIIFEEGEKEEDE